MVFSLIQVHCLTDMLVLASLSVIAIFGSIALISPAHFGIIAARGAQWVDSADQLRRAARVMRAAPRVLALRAVGEEEVLARLESGLQQDRQAVAAGGSRIGGGLE